MPLGRTFEEYNPEGEYSEKLSVLLGQLNLVIDFRKIRFLQLYLCLKNLQVREAPKADIGGIPRVRDLGMLSALDSVK